MHGPFLSYNLGQDFSFPDFSIDPGFDFSLPDFQLDFTLPDLTIPDASFFDFSGNVINSGPYSIDPGWHLDPSLNIPLGTISVGQASFVTSQGVATLPVGKTDAGVAGIDLKSIAAAAGAALPAIARLFGASQGGQIVTDSNGNRWRLNPATGRLEAIAGAGGGLSGLLSSPLLLIGIAALVIFGMKRK